MELHGIEQFLNKELFIGEIENLNSYKIVGIADKKSPSIYAEDKMITNIISLSQENNNQYYGMIDYADDQTEENSLILNYNLFADKIELKKGRMPENDYEVLVNNMHRYDMPLNKEIKLSVNDKKLKVVGYYDSKYNMDYYFVNSNTILYKTIKEKSGFIVETKKPNQTLEEFKALKLNIKNGYESSKEEYLKEKKETIRNSLTVSGIILAISLVEIFLMIRSSFLSRIREIGILRAIGVKRKDIYKMFMGEIIAITTMASVPGILLMSYILKKLSTIKYLERLFLIDIKTLIFSIIFIYLFNLIIGLIPVFKVVRKTPAQILSRHDI